jgi:hypothetical protein
MRLDPTGSGLFVFGDDERRELGRAKLHPTHLVKPSSVDGAWTRAKLVRTERIRRKPQLTRSNRIGSFLYLVMMKEGNQLEPKNFPSASSTSNCKARRNIAGDWTIECPIVAINAQIYAET